MKLTRFARFAWLVLAVTVFVILWGAYVRASGSGAGCGSHWPLCNGVVIPDTSTLHTLVEFTHRLTSGVSLLLVVSMVIWAFRAFPRRHPARLAATLSLIFMLTEAAVGAGLVLFRLVADNESVARALFMSVHLINTFVLLAMITLTAWWGSGAPSVEFRRQGSLPWLLLAGLLGALLVSTSGAVAALGDTLYPSSSLAEGIRQDFSATAHFLIRLRILHPTLAVTISLILLAIALFARTMRPSALTNRLSFALSTLVAIQLIVGAANVLLLAPIWMQIVHLLLADLVWVSLVLMSASALSTVGESVSAPAMSGLDLSARRN
jgi:heme A synthase